MLAATQQTHTDDASSHTAAMQQPQRDDDNSHKLVLVASSSHTELLPNVVSSTMPHKAVSEVLVSTHLFSDGWMGRFGEQVLHSAKEQA